MSLTERERNDHSDLGKATAWADASGWLRDLATERFMVDKDEVAKELRHLSKLAGYRADEIRALVAKRRGP